LKFFVKAAWLCGKRVDQELNRKEREGSAAKSAKKTKPDHILLSIEEPFLSRADNSRSPDLNLAIQSAFESVLTK